MLLTEYNEAEAMELFREEGRAQGRASALLESVANLMASTGCTAERAAEMLGVPAEERQRYFARL